MRNRRLFKLILPMLVVGLLSPFAFAQDDVDPREAEEAERREKFQTAMTNIVEDLNNGSFFRLSQAISNSDMIERIFGLRLIDQRIKRDFREDMRNDGEFEDFIATAYKHESEDGIRAQLLLVESRGDRGRAVVRFDMDHFQVNYIEYELEIGAWNRVYVIDWKDYLFGHQFSERVGLSLVQSSPNKNAARKLVDFPNVREQQVFQVMEILKSARDYDFDRYFEIYNDVDPSIQRQRPLLMAGLDAAKNARKRRVQRKILMSIDRYHPKDVLFSLSLLDFYFPDRQYEKAYDALIRVKSRLRIDDAVTNARLSSATLVMGRLEEAIALADKATQQEPDLELAWWAVLRAQVGANDYAAAIPALQKLQDQFGHSLSPEALAKDPTLRQFSRSDEYQQWFASKYVEPVAAEDEEPEA